MKLTRRNSPNLNVDSTFFDIMKEEQYWVLGILMSDGCISENRIILQLTGEDLETIEKVKKLISHIGNINYVKKNDSHRLSFRNQILVDKLAAMGCVPRKSLILEFPKIEDKDMIRHFIRGYFEGDGSVTFNKNRNYIKCNILGTRQFLAEVKKHLKEIININAEIYERKETTTCSLDISGNIQSTMFINWIYSGNVDNMMMLRKYKKAKSLYDKMVNARKTKFNLTLAI